MMYLRRYDLNWNSLFLIDGDTHDSRPWRRKSVPCLGKQPGSKNVSMEVRAMFRAITGRQTPIEGSYLH